MKLFRFLHKWLGLLMAPLMVMWFVSGYLMIFSGFPHANSLSKQQLLDHLTATDTATSVATLTAWYRMQSSPQAELSEVSLEQVKGQLRLQLNGTDGSYLQSLKSGVRIVDAPPSREDIEVATRRITCCPPASIDTLTNLNQWIPFAYRRDDLPFIKVSVADGEGTALYFSGATGELLQETNRHNRLLAYIGAIPHWLYFWQIRQSRELWTNLFITLGIIGCTMIISGIVMGIYRTMQSRRSSRKRWSPYPRKSSAWYYWHHITGLIFGLVVLTWMFSGWMSLDHLPQWLTGQPPREALYSLAKSNPLQDNEQIEWDSIIQEYPTAKRITYTHYMGEPIFRIETDGNSEAPAYLQLAEGQTKPLALTEEKVLSYLQNQNLDIEVKETELIQHYTSDYLPHPRGKRKPPLPAVRIETEEGTRLYIALATPAVQIGNKATRLNNWAYHKLHSFKYLWSYHHPTLWLVVMLLLLTGGLLVSLTGLVLAWRILCPKKKRRRQKTKTTPYTTNEA